MYKFLFDFDGVLVDSMTMWAKAVIELLEKNGVFMKIPLCYSI